jgi:hypothetical protein
MTSSTRPGTRYRQDDIDASLQLLLDKASVERQVDSDGTIWWGHLHAGLDRRHKVKPPAAYVVMVFEHVPHIVGNALSSTLRQSQSRPVSPPTYRNRRTSSPRRN